MAGNHSRRKGANFERFIVNELRAAGIDALRVPLSGSMRGFKQDVIVRHPAGNLTIEAKARARGYSFIYQSIEGADLLALKADRQETLVVMRLDQLSRLLSQSGGGEAAPVTHSTRKAIELRFPIQPDRIIKPLSSVSSMMQTDEA